MADGGAAVVIPDAELTAESLSPRESPSCSPMRTASGRWESPARRLAKPDAAQRIAHEVLGAVRRA